MKTGTRGSQKPNFIVSHRQWFRVVSVDSDLRTLPEYVIQRRRANSLNLNLNLGGKIKSSSKWIIYRNKGHATRKK